jgi:hypothetical protein
LKRVAADVLVLTKARKHEFHSQTFSPRKDRFRLLDSPSLVRFPGVTSVRTSSRVISTWSTNCAADVSHGLPGGIRLAPLWDVTRIECFEGEL